MRRSAGPPLAAVGPGLPGLRPGPLLEKDFSLTYETVDWSQARYDDYGFIALDVTPAPLGQKTTTVLRFINQQGRELDRVVFSRIAGNP